MTGKTCGGRQKYFFKNEEKMIENELSGIFLSGTVVRLTHQCLIKTPLNFDLNVDSLNAEIYLSKLYCYLDLLGCTNGWNN